MSDTADYAEHGTCSLCDIVTGFIVALVAFLLLMVF